MEASAEKHKLLTLTAVFFIVFLGDRVSKIIFLESGSFEVNKGIALSLFNSDAAYGLMFNIIGLLIVSVLLIVNSRSRIKLQIILIAVLAAGLGNLCDRIFLGGVVDFIRILFLPRFNLADLIITIGVLTLLILSLHRNGRETQSNS